MDLLGNDDWVIKHMDGFFYEVDTSTKRFIADSYTRFTQLIKIKFFSFWKNRKGGLCNIISLPDRVPEY